jgi:hypothetical protein
MVYQGMPTHRIKKSFLPTPNYLSHVDGYFLLYLR